MVTDQAEMGTQGSERFNRSEDREKRREKRDRDYGVEKVTFAFLSIS